MLRNCVLLNEVWIEYVELVTLRNLWGRVVHIVVGLIILVPFKTGVYPIEVSRLARAVPVAAKPCCSFGISSL